MKSAKSFDDKIILMIDTALNGCGVGLWANGTKNSVSKPMTAGQAEHLIPLVQGMVDDFKKLDAILVTIGPGAFTGMRIGISTAKSFGLALGIPVFGISSLQALALSYAEQASTKFAVLIDTKRGDFYVQGFDKNANPLTEPHLQNHEQTAIFLKNQNYPTCIGDGGHNFPALWNTIFNLPDCGLIARIFSQNPQSDKFTKNIKPLYLRHADTSISHKINRILED